LWNGGREIKSERTRRKHRAIWGGLFLVHETAVRLQKFRGEEKIKM